MSYDLIVYVCRDRLPADLDLERAAEEGVEIVIAAIDPESRADYLADLEASGETDDGYLAILDGSDTRVIFGAGKGAIEAARRRALALARACDGWCCDPQTGETRPGVTR